MSAQHPSVPSAGPGPATGADRFVSLRVPARGAAASGACPGEVVLARLDDELRPDAVVLARRDDGRAVACDVVARDAVAHDAAGTDAGSLEVRRVGRVTPESVELLPLDDAFDDAPDAVFGDPPPRVVPRVVPRAAGAVVGTVVLRWSAG